MSENKIRDIIKPEMPSLQALLSLNAGKDADVATLALQEMAYLEQTALTKPEILECEPSSIVLAVKNVLRKNLTMDPLAGLVYIKFRSVNVGTEEKKVWKKVLEIQETVNGILSYTRQRGLILDFTNPEVEKNQNGMVIGVSMQILKPSYPKPRWETFKYDESDFMRWKRASHKERSRNKKDADYNALNYANILYSSWQKGIDPEFARAKCLRHSLKKLGANPNEIPLNSMNTKTAVINPEIAATEAGDNIEFDQHEEVSSEINQQENHNNDFNTDDL